MSEQIAKSAEVRAPVSGTSAIKSVQPSQRMPRSISTRSSPTRRPLKRPTLTIGIEEEYQIVDPQSRALHAFIVELIREKPILHLERKFEPELHQSMLELKTPICATIEEARGRLIEQRQSARYLVQEKGLAIVAAGTHPFSHWQEQPITPYTRFTSVAEKMQDVVKRLLIFGMHVHIGIEDRDFAIDTMNVVRYMLPHILALSASSPFWLGQQTGLKSYRATLFEDLPRTGIPDVYGSVADYDDLIQTLILTGCIDSPGTLWWDVRPHYTYPTLEFRICDVCPRVDEAIAIVALLQAIVLWHWKLRTQNLTFRVYRRELLEENRWRAARNGLDGKLIDFGKEIEVPTRQLVEELLQLVEAEIDELGTAAYIEPIRAMLTDGTSADRQLRVYKEAGGNLNAVVDHLIDETYQGL